MAFQDDDFKYGGLLSTYNLNNNYSGWHSTLRGKTGWDGENKASKMEMVALDKFDRGSAKRKSIPSSLRRKSKSLSSIREKLMTPRTVMNFSTHCNSAAIGSHDNHMTSRSVASNECEYSERRQYENDNHAVATLAKNEITKANDSSYVSSTKDTSNSNINLLPEISLTNTNGWTENITQSLPVSTNESGVYNSVVQPLTESHKLTTSMMTMDNTGDLIREIDLRRETSHPSYNTIMERTSTYTKRVIEETETVTN